MQVDPRRLHARDEPPHLRRRRDADRVREHHLDAGEARRQLRDHALVHAPLERTAERARERHRDGPVRPAHDRLHSRDRLRKRRVPVPPVERLRRGERAVHALQPGGAQPLPAALVQDEPRILDAVARLDPRHDLLGAGHRRNGLVPHERDGLDARHPSRREPVHEQRAGRGLQNDALVLEPVTRPDVADG